MTKKAIYIEVEDRNPFGPDIDERVFKDPTFTSDYIPGYSDKRHENDVRKSKSEPIKPLKHRFHWARCRSLKNTDASDGHRVQHWKQQHYHVADYDKMIEEGYDLRENDAITKGPDGQAYWGEHILMIATAEVASANYVKNEQAIKDQEETAANTMDAAVERFNKTPTAQKTGMKAGHFEIVE